MKVVNITFCALAILLTSFLSTALAFTPNSALSRTFEDSLVLQALPRKIRENEIPVKKIANSRRKKLGIADDEDEYDLEMALDNNTDPFITKVIAGSLILSITALLVAGIVIPATTDYGEGVCNALLTGGRC